MPKLVLSVAAALAGLAIVAAPARAQTPPDHQALMAAMEKARAEAVRPGDASLSCEALEKELMDASTNPALHARVEAAAAARQRELATAQAAAQGGAATSAGTAMSSVVPGADAAALAAQAAQAQSQRAQAAAGMQMRIQQAQSMMEHLPQMMRSQRVMELAQNRRCDWLQGMQGAPGR